MTYQGNVPTQPRRRPAHRAYRPVDYPPHAEVHFVPEHRAGDVLFELEAPEESRIELGRYLVEERGWPPIFAARNVDLFASAVLRRYVRARGHEPEWDRGYIYRGFTDYLIVRDTYDEEMGALVEQLAHEGGAS